MIRVSFEVSEDQAEEIIESIDELDEGEQWEPELSFAERDARGIRTKVYYQLQARRGR